MKQGISQRSSWVTSQRYKEIYNNNPNVKHIFSNGIDVILKEVFSDKFKKINEYQDGDLPGIYDLEQPGRSLINKLNTNYSALSVIVTDVNKVLKSKGLTEIKLIESTPEEQIKEMKKLLDVIDEYKYRIFSPESRTFKSIIDTISMTSKKGDDRENYVIKKLKEKFGEENVKKIGRLGSITDATKGIDCIITWNGKTYTCQIKPFSEAVEKDNKITIYGSLVVKKYYTDWIIFEKDKKEIQVYSNKNTEIIDGNFVFPKNDRLGIIK